MEVITHSTPLKNELHLKSGTVLRTIGDAAMFIIKLPKEYDGRFHWRTAGANLEAADRDTANLQVATESLKQALRTENMLKG
jgi:hypothetical protein